MVLRRIARTESERDPASRAMVAEYAAVLAGDGARWIRELTGSSRPPLDRGEMRAVLWLRGGREGAGLAMWEFLPGVGRRVWLYLAPPHRSVEALGELLAELEDRSEHDGPVASVVDFIPGLDPSLQEEVLEPRGYFATERLVLRLPTTAPFPDESLFGRPDLRPIEPGDSETLIGLIRSAYDPLAGQAVPTFAYRDPRQDARDTIEEILDGRRGEWVPWASFGVEVAGQLVGASLVSQLNVPILSEVMVHPTMRGIGLGYYLILESVRVLRERGAGEPHAVVSGQDLRALRLFRRAGFEVAEERAVGLWVNRVAFGVLPSR